MSDGGKQSAELHIVIDPTMEKDRALLVAPDCFDEQGNPIPEKIALIKNIGARKMFRNHPLVLNLQDTLDQEREQILAYSRHIGELNGELNDLNWLVGELSETNKKLRIRIKELEKDLQFVKDWFSETHDCQNNCKLPMHESDIEKCKYSDCAWKKLWKILKSVDK